MKERNNGLGLGLRVRGRGSGESGPGTRYCCVLLLVLLSCYKVLVLASQELGKTVFQMNDCRSFTIPSCQVTDAREPMPSNKTTRPREEHNNKTRRQQDLDKITRQKANIREENNNKTRQATASRQDKKTTKRR